MKQLNNTASIASQYLMWMHVCVKTRKANTLVVLIGIALGTFLSVGLTTVYAANIYVTKAGSPDPDGSSVKPYQMVEAGIVRAKRIPGSTVLIGPGKYYETLTIDRPCTLTAAGGTATIGEMDYEASTTLELVTLNTHLCGDVHFCDSWRDKERAEDISFYIRDTLKRSPDVICFQEIWDDDVFLGDPGDWEGEGIRRRAGYPYGKHGTANDCLGCWNSGLAIMSWHLMTNWAQLFWGRAADDMCNGTDCMAGKGWVQTNIEKDGFNIWIVNLHADAHASPGDREARRNQLAKLRDFLIIWMSIYPSHAFFVVGDFNIVGESSEYDGILVDRLGRELGGRDGDRNSPGFIVDGSYREQWTSNDQNPLSREFDSAENGRLDYIFYFPSWDGSVEVLPMAVEVREFRGRWLTESDTTTNESSDHYSVHGKFKLIKTR